MAYNNMTPAVSGQPASSSANNQIIANVDDLDTRLDVVEGFDSGTRLDDLEALTGQAGPAAVGNYALGDRLGLGVTTTDTATEQLDDLDSRVTSLEQATGVTQAPQISVVQTTAHQIGANYTKVELDVVRFSHDITFDAVTDEIIFNTAGLYLVEGGISFLAGNNAGRGVLLYKNGSRLESACVFEDHNSSFHAMFEVQKLDRFVVGDRLALWGWSNTGVNTKVDAPEYRPYLGAARLSS